MHERGRKISDELLQQMSADELWALAGECDIEPADETICDACAALMIWQDKDSPEPPDPEVEKFESTVAETIEAIHDLRRDNDRLKMEALRHRDWLFQPDDKVLVLAGDTIYNGVVVRVCIPGPVRDDLTIYVRCDDERVRLQWWNQDQVERIAL
jgi:hypothetical protein